MSPLQRLFLFVANLALCVCMCACEAAGSAPSPAVPLDVALGNKVFAGAATTIDVLTPRPECTVSPRPGFAWTATGRRIVYLGIFDANLTVSNDRIANPQANVWAWHTGLGRGREGNVRFEDGVDVKNGSLQPGSPTSLQAGRPYVFAVWAWDDDGRSVVASSTEIRFRVDAGAAEVCN